MDTALKVATLSGFSKDGLLARYALREGSGSTASDSSPNAYHLTLAASTATPTWASGGGLTGDGSDDYASVILPATTLAALTLELVYASTTTALSRVPLGLGNNTTSARAYLRTHSATAGRMQATLTNDAGASASPTAAPASGLNDGNPHYLALVWDGASVTIDSDGSLNAPVAYSGAITVTRAGLLALVSSTIAGQWAGTVRAAAVYNRALTSVEREGHRALYRRAGVL